MKWFAEWSSERKRAWIINEDGATVIEPCIATIQHAHAICRQHNQEIGAVIHRTASSHLQAELVSREKRVK